jgi:hypothetical protein
MTVSIKFAQRLARALIFLLAMGFMPFAIAQQIPRYQVDAAWPKPLPNGWIMGQVGGVAVDAQDNIWVYQRPGSLTDDERGAQLKPPVSKCCRAAPPVMQFDSDGNLLQAWGGPGKGYDWPKSEHGIHVDKAGNVWLAGNDKDNDHMLLKFSSDGRFLLQIGKAGKTTDSRSAEYLGRPAMAVVDEKRGELYVADGYKNRRVIVFDPATGAYRRHWGAYGKEARDLDPGPYNPGAAPAEQFRTPVHCVRISNDEFVYVCDRASNRIQVFRKSGAFVKEFFVEPNTRGAGSVWDIAFSNDAEQTYMFVTDGTNNEIHILQRESGTHLTSFGRPGRMAGEFHWVHGTAMDSRGNLYFGEVDTGKRVQRFLRVE